jgi:NAD+ synthase|tara:strand:+ start:268 stop:540 length:273 start_codon:yes stop_codon:yes gene_type:complete
LAHRFGLSKRQLRLLAKTMGAPSVLVTNTPSADLECLSPQKEDDYVLGVSYDDIYDFLEDKAVSAEVEELLIATYSKTQQKRLPIAMVYG